ncbi:MAG: hypothetical protein OXG29_09730, partial [Gammaproteobacteria bacterium]|nr:hypothetical protein [Gammaproteobacteria bacterium]
TPPRSETTGPTVSLDTVLQEMLPKCIESDAPLRVVDDAGAVVGAVSRKTLLRGLADRTGKK